MGNLDPEVDPARGQLAVKSLPAQLAEVPNSQDDDAPLPVGITSAATVHTEPDMAAHHGAVPSHKAPSAACDTVAMSLFCSAVVLLDWDWGACIGSRAAEDLDNAAPSSAARHPAPLDGTEAAAPSTGRRATAVLQRSKGMILCKWQ